MRKLPITSALLFVLIACISCTTSPSDQMTVTVTPQTGEVEVGSSLELVASGAVTYQWAITYGSSADTNQIWGLLDTTTGDSVNYRNMRTPDKITNAIQIITVTGYAGGHGTNSSELTSSAEAFITHLE